MMIFWMRTFYDSSGVFRRWLGGWSDQWYDEKLGYSKQLWDGERCLNCCLALGSDRWLSGDGRWWNLRILTGKTARRLSANLRVFVLERMPDDDDRTVAAMTNRCQASYKWWYEGYWWKNIDEIEQWWDDFSNAERLTLKNWWLTMMTMMQWMIQMMMMKWWWWWWCLNPWRRWRPIANRQTWVNIDCCLANVMMM